uniref:Uncharacterized protein n=1 Tax=Rhizophora mucronata TaxID=61149 RepID=A0A2P2PAC0_RHIMU
MILPIYFCDFHGFHLILGEFSCQNCMYMSIFLENHVFIDFMGF